MEDIRINIMFTCRGNTIKSPAAEFMLRAKLPKSQMIYYNITSAATTKDKEGHYTEGRLIEVLRCNGVPCYAKLVRDVSIFNTYDFDLIYDLEEMGVSNPVCSSDFIRVLNEITYIIDNIVMQDIMDLVIYKMQVVR